MKKTTLPRVGGTALPAAAIALLSRGAGAETMPSPSPPPSPMPMATAAPVSAGPCASPALGSIAVRPGIGRAPATSGAVCVALPGEIVIGAGYRDQTTIGTGRQHLEVYPAPVALIGVADRIELIIAAGLTYSRRTGVSGSAMFPAAGQQDAAFGAQYLLGDRATLQQAVAVVTTLPTGYPVGPSGFSAGTPSYALSYSAAFDVGVDVAFSTSQGFVVATGAAPNALNERYIAYQPTFNVSYALAPSATLLLEDQITAPSGPHDPTGNRLLFGFAQTVSPDVVADAEYEINLLPTPGFNQHSFGVGLTVRI